MPLLSDTFNFVFAPQAAQAQPEPASYGPEWDPAFNTPSENGGDNVWAPGYGTGSSTGDDNPFQPEDNTPYENGGDNAWAPGRYDDAWY